MTTIYITLAVEDSLSETVARKILKQSDKNYCVINCLGRKGFGYLKTKINKFNEASKQLPFFVLTDQDNGCPPEKIDSWLKCKANSNFIFRIAVMEIESWVMADRDSFSEFLGIAKANIPYKMDELPDPKQFLLNMTQKSRKRRLKEDIIPIPGSTAKIGPDYNACISDFVRDRWNVRKAIRHSESLNRAFKKIQEFSHIHT
jgi:hypothetical protein